MSTRANVVIKDEHSSLWFYRHSDGYPECTAVSLIEFLSKHTKGSYRPNVGQSAGWLVIQGHKEYDSETTGWKVGAYEPTTGRHGDIEYLYVCDLDKMSITIYSSSWDGVPEPGKFTVNGDKMLGVISVNRTGYTLSNKRLRKIINNSADQFFSDHVAILHIGGNNDS